MAGQGAFGRIHGHVGTPQQCDGIVAMQWGECNANACRHGHAVALQRKGQFQSSEDLVGSQDRARGVGCGQQKGKLITTQAGDRVGGTQSSQERCPTCKSN